MDAQGNLKTLKQGMDMGLHQCISAFPVMPLPALPQRWVLRALNPATASGCSRHDVHWDTTTVTSPPVVPPNLLGAARPTKLSFPNAALFADADCPQSTLLIVYTVTLRYCPKCARTPVFLPLFLPVLPINEMTSGFSAKTHRQQMRDVSVATGATCQCQSTFCTHLPCEKCRN
jgi:hypothetical protein